MYGQAAGGAGSGSSYQSESRSEAHATIGPVKFGDVAAGRGSGFGLQFNPLTLGIAGLVLVAFFYFRRKK